MGQISKKLARRFTKWSGRFRQEARTIPIPKDVHDVETLVKDGHDPWGRPLPRGIQGGIQGKEENAMRLTLRSVSTCIVVMGVAMAVPAGDRAAGDQQQKAGSEAHHLAGPSAATGRLPFEDSPFGFHPATVPPNIGGGDRWRCARQLGVRWHRPVVYAFWFLCQPTHEDYAEGTFRWRPLDDSLGQVPEGINVLWNLSARNYTPEGSWLPRDVEGYEAYVRAVVERYDGDGVEDAPGSPVVRYWQVENEPNLSHWGGTPRQYAGLLRHAYKAARQANPQCKIVIGGVGGWVGRGPNSSLLGFRRFHLPVLEQLEGTGFDIFDYHWYGNARGDYRGYGRVHGEVRAALDRHGFKHAPIWITEMGSFSGAPRGNPPQSESDQAADLVRRYVYPLSLGVEKVFWAFGLVEGFKRDNDYFDHTGLIYDGRDGEDRGRGVRKLAYFTYQLMTEKLEGKRFADALPDLPENVYAYRFGKGPDAVTVVWWDWWNEPQATGKTVTLPMPGGARVTSAITDRQGRRRSWQAKASGGLVTLDLAKAPLLLAPGGEGDRGDRGKSLTGDRGGTMDRNTAGR